MHRWSFETVCCAGAFHFLDVTEEKASRGGGRRWGHFRPRRGSHRAAFTSSAPGLRATQAAGGSVTHADRAETLLDHHIVLQQRFRVLLAQPVGRHCLDVNTPPLCLFCQGPHGPFQKTGPLRGLEFHSTNDPPPHPLIPIPSNHL